MNQKAKTKAVDSAERRVQWFVQSRQIQIDSDTSIRALAIGESRAERTVGWGLRKSGMGKRELGAAPKGQVEKQVLAWWPHGRTTASRRWIAEELRMGYESRASRAVSWVEASRARNVVEMKRRLEDYNAPRISWKRM